jgi:hypothetical protein
MQGACSTSTVKLRALATVLCLLLPAVYAAAQALPPTSLVTLTNRKVSLPDDLGTQPALIVIGYTRKSRDQCASWAKRAMQELPALRVYQIAALQDVPRLLRPMVVRGIRSGVPKEHHGRFLLLYEKQEQWREATGAGQPDEAYLLMVDSAGRIKWRISGAITEEKIRSLKIQAQHLQPAS